MERSLAHRAEQTRELARRTAELTATARSRDGLVEVTVGAEARVERIHLGERTLFNGEEVVVQTSGAEVIFAAGWGDWDDMPEVAALRRDHRVTPLAQPLL